MHAPPFRDTRPYSLQVWCVVWFVWFGYRLGAPRIQPLPDCPLAFRAQVPGKVHMPLGVFVVMVAVGDGFTFALADDGTVWGWGCFKDDNSGAGFAPGVKLQRLPAAVYQPTSVRDRARKVVAGARHVAVLTRRGEVLTFGMGGQGQLGRIPEYDNASYPPLDTLLKPSLVPGLEGIGEVQDVGCGSYSTFLVGRDGVLAWGLNNAGQLGIPAADREAPMSAHMVWQPRDVAALAGAATVAGGEHHSLALTKKGAVLAFGAPTYGMLGRTDVDAGDSNRAVTPGAIALTDGLEDEHPVSICAATNVSGLVTKEGNAYMWGSNVNAQMAKGNDDDDNVHPTRMRRHKAFGNRRIYQLSFGGQHGVLLASTAAEEGSVPPATPAA